MNLKITYTSILLCISALVFGQTLPESPQGIRANFTAKSIEAYQENSQNKIREFYEYLTLYSNEKNTELKKQIRENILSLTDSDMEILDFTSTVPSEIELDKFLSKIENQSFEFKIKSVQNSAETGSNDWINSYLLSVIQNGKTSDFKLNQTINFEPKEKQFGSKTKTVWEMKLGDVTAD
jgi:hypothetical protein